MPSKPIKVKIEEFKEDVFEKLDVVESEIKEQYLPRSSCSLMAVSIFLLSILLFSVGVLIVLKKTNFNLSKIHSRKNQVLVQSKTTETDGVVKIRVTDKELNDGIASAGDSFPIKKAVAHINPGNITINGKSGNSIFAPKIEVILLPKTSAGKLDIQIQSIKSGGVAAPKVISDSISKSLGSMIASYLPATDSIDIQKVSLYDGFLDITGTKK